ncbi:four helix bundle protein [Aurantibacter crassamenti]|uniref:four helix bundle protein n=1 Tax=Aurantibacter crassamenti TaxID=1837375 RepID=UPI00293D5ED8|nr:four helix bundle protein [Aurantibacter crassamenti]
MRDFRKLDIWNNGIEIVKQIYIISEKLPAVEKFGLKSQITRAAISIPSNIAEGCSRNSELEFKRFFRDSYWVTFRSRNAVNYYNRIKIDFFD